MRYSLFVILFFNLIHFSVFSQEEDEKQPAHKYVSWNSRFTRFSSDNKLFDTFVLFDTTLTNFHQFNQTGKSDNFLIETANINSVYFNLAFDNNIITGLKTSLFSFSEYSFLKNNIAFFDTKTPFSYLFYAQGDKETQYLNAIHSRNISPWWNFTLNFSATGTEGYYLRQALHNRHFYISTNFRTKDNKYRLFASYIFNRYRQYCNGGIQSMGFDSIIWRNRLIQPVNLDEAEQTFKNNSINLYQFFLPDSTSHILLAHSFSFNSNYYKFTDENIRSGYYFNFYHDSVKTNDSILWKLTENNVYLTNNIPNKFNLNFNIGIRHQSMFYRNMNIDTPIFYLGIFTDLSKQIHQINLKFLSENALNGSLKGDYKYQAGVEIHITKNAILKSYATFAQITPGLFYLLTDMNQLRWSNNFQKVNYQQINLNFANPKYHLLVSASLNNLTNYVYFGDSVKPIAYLPKIQVFSLKINHLLRIGSFNMQNHLLIQYSSKQDIIPLPLWALNHQFYYESDLYQNKLRLQAGYSVFIHQKYNMPYYYAPANVFYVQNKTLTGFYPGSEIFLNLAIKRARIFLKTEQLHTFFMLKNSWKLPSYPVNPFSFKFGVSWLFFD